LVAVKQAAALLGIGLTSTWGLIAAGRIEVARIGGRTLVVLASADSLVESLLASAREQCGGPRKSAENAPVPAGAVCGTTRLPSRQELDKHSSPPIARDEA
jgi:hypothetical protein